MSVYLKRLGAKTVGVFAATLAALLTASQPLNLLEVSWGPALAVSGGAAFLALLEGIAGRFTGDAEQPRVLS